MLPPSHIMLELSARVNSRLASDHLDPDWDCEIKAAAPGKGGDEAPFRCCDTEMQKIS